VPEHDRLALAFALPLPAATQWEIVEEAAEVMKPARDELIRQAAQGEVLHNDDQVNAQDEINVQNERTNVAVETEACPADGDCIARTVAQVWRKTLRVPVGGPDDDFFEVGGDSLKSITFVIDLERALGLELPLTLIAEIPTFARLCDSLREHWRYPNGRQGSAGMRPERRFGCRNGTRRLRCRGRLYSKSDPSNI
jgi:acyl carrier protein